MTAGWVGQSFPQGVNAPNTSQAADFEVLNKLYPGLILNPSPLETNGAYSVLREINGAQWTMQNADIGAAGFFQVNPGKTSWAFTLLNGGGFAMYSAAAGSAPSPFFWTRVFYVDASGQSSVGNGEFNIRAYGAKGDGVTDDTAAINAALTACASNPGGGTTIAPTGTYLISGSMFVGNNTWFRGESQFSTIFTCALGFQGAAVKNGFPQDPSVAMIVNTAVANVSATPLQQNMRVSDMQFNGRADIISGDIPNNGATIFFRQVANVIVDHCEFVNCPNTAVQITGTATTTAWPVNFNVNARVTDCRMNLTVNPGGPPPVYTPDGMGGYIVPIVVLIRGLNQFLFTDNVVGDLIADAGAIHTNDALDIVGVSHCTITDNSFYNCGDGIGFNTGNYCVIENNLIDQANGVGIAMYASNGPVNAGTGQIYVSIANNIITNLGQNIAFSANPGKTGIIIGSNTQPSANASYMISCIGNMIHWASTATGPTGIEIESNHTIVALNIINMNNNAMVLKGIRVNTGEGGGNNCLISGNQVWNGATGSTAYEVDFNNSNNAANLSFVNNQSQGVPTKFATSGSGVFTSCTSRGNDWNPFGLLVPPGGSGTGPQNLPASGTVVTNSSVYDVMITTSGTGAITQVALNGQNTGLAATAGNSQTIFLQAGSTIAVTYTGTVQWTWYAN